MKKVVIVSYHFAPLNTMAAKRYSYMCRYLRDNGYDYKVITATAHRGCYLDAKLDLHANCPPEKIIRIGRVGIEYPIKAVHMSLLLKYVQSRGFFSRIIVPMSLGWYYKVKDELDFEEISDADCVIGTFPDASNLFIAMYISRKLGIPFVAEVRDLISDYSEGHRKRPGDEKLELLFEKCILNNACAIVAVTDGFTRILRRRYSNKKIETVYNGWESYDSSLEKRNDSCKEIEKCLYFAGSLYEHRVESILYVAEIIKNSGLNMRIVIRSIGPKKLTEQLLQKSEERELMPFIEVREAAAEGVVRHEQEHALINLMPTIMSKTDSSLVTTIPGKLFELLEINRPILAVCPEGTEIDRIITSCKKGVATADAQKIKRFLLADYVNYEGAREIERYSRREQTNKLCTILDWVIQEGRK